MTDEGLAERSDEELVGMCQQGSLTAFEELYRRYQRPILAYIYQITRNYEESGCIAQDVFLKVFENVGRFDLERRFSTWFYTIARNASIDYLQSRRRRVMVSFTDIDRQPGDDVIVNTTEASTENVINNLSRTEANQALSEALAELPQIYREIVELIIFQSMSYEAASQILGGVSLGTLRSRMFHALRQLRQLLSHYAGVDGAGLV